MCRKVELTPEEERQMKLIKRELRKKPRNGDVSLEEDPYLAGAKVACADKVQGGDNQVSPEVLGVFESFQPSQRDELEQLPTAVPVFCCQDACSLFAIGHMSKF